MGGSKQYESPCIKCGHPTGHRSMLCLECRKIKCLCCERVFAAYKEPTKFCCECKAKLSYDQKLEYKNKRKANKYVSK